MRYTYESFLKELGARAESRCGRNAAGRTSERWWSSTGSTSRHWQSFENGKAISVPSLLRVCEVFDVSPSRSSFAWFGTVSSFRKGPGSSQEEFMRSKPTTGFKELWTKPKKNG